MKLKYLTLVLSVVISCLQFTPMIWETGLYPISKFIIFLFLLFLSILSLLSSNKSVVCFCKYSLLRTHLLALIFVVLSFIILYSIGAFVRFEPVYEFSLSLLFVVLSINVKLSEAQFGFLLKIYLLFVFLLGGSIVFYYAHGFYISELYLPIPKNQIGPFLSIAFLVSIFLSTFASKRIYFIIYICVAVAFFVFLLILRARANIVASLLGLFVFLFFYKKKITYIVISSMFFILILVFTSLGELLFNSFFLNYDMSDMDSISAGRVDVYKFGFNFFEENLFTGELFNGSIMSDNTIHNYLLHKLVAYGIFFSIPFVVVYVNYLFMIVRNNFLESDMNLYNIGNLLCIVPFVISLFEYTYPFGPGTPLLFPYFCLGQYLINKIK